MVQAREVTVYVREECHLCEEVIETIDDVAAEVDPTVSVGTVDVDTDPELRDRYGERVPYVLVDGSPAFKYHVDAGELRGLLGAGR